MSIINNNNNNVPIDDRFHVSWYTKHLVIYSTASNGAE